MFSKDFKYIRKSNRMELLPLFRDLIQVCETEVSRPFHCGDSAHRKSFSRATSFGCSKCQLKTLAKEGK